MMLLNEAIELLIPFHNPTLVCVIHNPDKTLTGQLSTGCPLIPFIAVNHNQIHLEDVLEVIEAHSVQAPTMVLPSLNLFSAYSDNAQAELFGEYAA